MYWLKKLCLVLITGCLAVYAAETGRYDKETPRILGQSDVKFLVNPLDIFYAKNPTSKPTTIVVKPAYPAYPYPYPPHPYPAYPYPDYSPDYPHPTFAPTHTTRRPQRPKPSQQYHYHQPPPHRPPYGYYPIYNSPTPRPLPSTGQRPILLVYGPEYHHQGYQPSDWDTDNYNNDVNSVAYPLTKNAQAIEALEDNQIDFEEQEGDIETDDRNVKLSRVSLVNDSEEDSDAIANDGQHIKLPFGIQLASHKDPASAKSNKRLKDQEGLIYFRNFKKGRNLEK